MEPLIIYKYRENVLKLPRELNEKKGENMTENEIEKYFVRRVKQEGGSALKFVSPSMAGVPDRIVMMPKGRLYFVELKRPNGKPRKLQSAVHRIFENLGFHVYVIDTKDKTDKFLRGEKF